MNRPYRSRSLVVLALLLMAPALVALAGCTSDDGPAAGATTTVHTDPPPAGPVTSASKPCGATTKAPKTYDHVVVLLEENRTWTGGRTPAVGIGFSGGKMPYLAGLAKQCSYYTDWAETNGEQNSLNQYIGLTSGVASDSTVNDCQPSATCQSTDDNIFRQVRVAGGTPRSFVDGATQNCSADGNAAKHIPALYFQGGDDASFCPREVMPLTRLDPDHLPTFAFITPDLCNDGHDCTDDVVDAWAKQTLLPILGGKSYAQGKTLVVVTYDEDQPVPNVLIAPTANKGAISSVAGSHADLLKTIELALGLKVMDQGQLLDAISLRPTSGV